MNTFATPFILVLALFAAAAPALADSDKSPPKTSAIQTITVSGTDLTGLNASSLGSLLSKAKQQGAAAVVVDMGSVSHMTPAGMEALAVGAQIFGQDNFAVANLSGEPAKLVQGEGAGQFQSFPSVPEAIAALKK